VSDPRYQPNTPVISRGGRDGPIAAPGGPAWQIRIRRGPGRIADVETLSARRPRPVMTCQTPVISQQRPLPAEGGAADLEPILAIRRGLGRIADVETISARRARPVLTCQTPVISQQPRYQPRGGAAGLEPLRAVRRGKRCVAYVGTISAHQPRPVMMWQDPVISRQPPVTTEGVHCAPRAVAGGPAWRTRTRRGGGAQR
jgi:hypothetical protein